MFLLNWTALHIRWEARVTPSTVWSTAQFPQVGHRAPTSWPILSITRVGRMRSILSKRAGSHNFHTFSASVGTVSHPCGTVRAAICTVLCTLVYYYNVLPFAVLCGSLRFFGVAAIFDYLGRVSSSSRRRPA